MLDPPVVARHIPGNVRAFGPYSRWRLQKTSVRRIRKPAFFNTVRSESTMLAPDETVRPPKTREDLCRFLDDLGIKHSTRDHAPVFTVAESVALRDEIPGGHTKNLFVKDKKDNFFLLTVEENAAVDLKTVHGLIGAASKVSFGKPEKLMEFLGVIPGSVTAFGAINDTSNNVTFVLDADLMEHEIVNCHPLTNDATTSIAGADLIRFMEATGHTPLVLKVTA